MRYLLMALCALGLVACDNGESNGDCLTDGCPASHRCVNVGEEADAIEYQCVEASCLQVGCFDDDLVCKNIGRGEDGTADYACVKPLPLGAECEDQAQCEENCSRLDRDSPVRICTSFCRNDDECPDGFSCKGESGTYCLADD